MSWPTSDGVRGHALTAGSLWVVVTSLPTGANLRWTPDRAPVSPEAPIPPVLVA
jgi:hypothetical protein